MKTRAHGLAVGALACALLYAGCTVQVSGSRAATAEPAPAPRAFATPAPAAAAPAAPAAPAAMPPDGARKGYILFRSVFPDPTLLRPYGRAVLSLVAQFDGRFIVTADRPVAVEGVPETRRIVIIEFPSLARAEEFYRSAEYAEVRELREGIGQVEAILFEGR